jgi:hypothetical protein
MPWAKVDDGWWCHPKVMGLSLAACGLWIKAVSWSCAQRRDTVPVAFLAMVGGSKDEANELASAGLWVESDAGWRIHDWSHYQDRSTSEKRAEAGRKGGIASGESRRSEEPNRSKAEAKAEAGTHPIPSRPDPTPSSSSVLPVDSDPAMPVDEIDGDEAEAAVLDAIADLRLSANQAAGKVKTSPAGWRKTCRRNLPEEVGPRVRELVGIFDEPARTLAEVVENGRATTYLTRKPVAS